MVRSPLSNWRKNKGGTRRQVQGWTSLLWFEQPRCDFAPGTGPDSDVRIPSDHAERPDGIAKREEEGIDPIE